MGIPAGAAALLTSVKKSFSILAHAEGDLLAGA
jgi:hypothetical protein